MRIDECKSRKDLISCLEETRMRRLELRMPHEEAWWNNLALLAGDHYSWWNPVIGEYQERPNVDHRTRLVINQALVVARTELAKLTKARPIMEVIANSEQAEDISAAKVSKFVLDYAEWKFKLRKGRKQALWWMIATGLGCRYVGWDPNDDSSGSIEYVIDPQTEEPTFDQNRLNELKEMEQAGEIKLVKEKYALGEIEYHTKSPFQLLPDEGALEWEDITDLICTDVLPIGKIMDTWRPKEEITPEDVDLGVVQKRMMARLGLGMLQPTEAKDSAAVHTWWLLPGTYRHNRFLAPGCMIRWCNHETELEYSASFPYSDGRMPYVFYQHIPRATTIWPDSVLSHIRGINLELDKTISQIIENKDYMANPQWLVATQHQIRGKIKNKSGAVVRYVAVPNVPPPQRVEGTPLPAQVENLVVGLRDQILDLSGQGETSRGRVPSGVRSGVAVQYLQEEDETRLGPTVENFEDSIALEASLSLSRFGQFYHTSRLLRVYKPDGSYDVRRFKGSDLKNTTDVQTQAGSALPKSKAARQQFALDLASKGFPIERKRLMDILELGTGEPDEIDKDWAQAERENHAMVMGTPLAGSPTVPDGAGGKVDTAVAFPVKNWHNHQAHLERHYSFMKNEEFERLMVENPEIVRLFDEHTGMHEQVLMQQMQAQMQAQLAAKGAPDGPPGTASQPTPPEAPGP